MMSGDKREREAMKLFLVVILLSAACWAQDSARIGSYARMK